MLLSIRCVGVKAAAAAAAAAVAVVSVVGARALLGSESVKFLCTPWAWVPSRGLDGRRRRVVRKTASCAPTALAVYVVSNVPTDLPYAHTSLSAHLVQLRPGTSAKESARSCGASSWFISSTAHSALPIGL